MQKILQLLLMLLTAKWPTANCSKFSMERNDIGEKDSYMNATRTETVYKIHGW